jgi:hypothetical protein
MFPQSVRSSRGAEVSSRPGSGTSCGPVETGGESYICPQKSVSIIRMRSIAMLFEWEVRQYQAGSFFNMSRALRNHGRSRRRRYAGMFGFLSSTFCAHSRASAELPWAASSAAKFK